MKLRIILSVFVLASLSLLLGAAAQQANCAADATILQSRVISSELGVSQVRTDIKVTNTGRCPLQSIMIEVSLPYGARIIAQSNLHVVERNKLYTLSNFTSSNTNYLAPNASFSGAGFVVAASYIANVMILAHVNCSSSGNNSCMANSNSTQSMLPQVSGQNSVSEDAQRQLQTASREAERLKLLNPGDFVFDFTRATTGLSDGKGGRTVAATPDNFPAVIGHDISMTVGFIDACGINTPHTHPRATEINFIVKGSFQAGFLQENGVSFIGNTLSAGMATIFPKGAIHFEQNMNCEPAMFVAAFNNQDPGVQTTATSFFGLPVDTIQAALNETSMQTVEDIAKFLPMNPAQILECKKRCGLM